MFWSLFIICLVATLIISINLSQRRKELKNMDYKEEIKKTLNKYGEEQYEAGRLQGVYEFYRALKETHETPDEIYERLIKRN